MGRLYTIRWDAATAITVVIDVFEIGAADDLPVYVHELKLWQTTDLGDAAEEIIGISIIRGFTTSGSGGGTPTVGKRYATDTAQAFTAECRNTTVATTGTGVYIASDAWNVRMPYIWTPTPENRPFVSQKDGLLLVRLDAAPADSITMNASMIVEEIG